RDGAVWGATVRRRAAWRRACSAAATGAAGASTTCDSASAIAVILEAGSIYRTAQALALGDAQEPRKSEDHDDANNQRRDHRDENFRWVKTQGGRSAHGWSAPRQNIHGAVDKTCNHR